MRLAAAGVVGFSTSGWIEALDTLIALDPTVVVPGHGGVGTVNDLRILREYFTALQRLGNEAVRENLSLEDALAQLDVKRDPDLGPAVKSDDGCGEEQEPGEAGGRV